MCFHFFLQDGHIMTDKLGKYSSNQRKMREEQLSCCNTPFPSGKHKSKGRNAQYLYAPNCNEEGWSNYQIFLKLPRESTPVLDWTVMIFYICNLACRIHDFMMLEPYSQPLIGRKLSESRFIPPCFVSSTLDFILCVPCPGETCSLMAFIENWEFLGSTVPEVHTVERVLHEPFIDCMTGTLIKFVGNLS